MRSGTDLNYESALAAPGGILRINVGSPTDLTDAKGFCWLADRSYLGGDALEHPVAPVASALRPGLFLSERVGLDGYRFSIPNDRYIVLLHLVENSQDITDACQRVFTIRVGDASRVDVDPLRIAGGHRVPLVYSFPFVVQEETPEDRSRSVGGIDESECDRDPSRSSNAGCRSAITLVSAAVIMASVPAVLVYVLFQRYFVSGLAQGGLRG